jgi:hypothetical protein
VGASIYTSCQEKEKDHFLHIHMHIKGCKSNLKEDAEVLASNGEKR